jgi:tetratricopeptide (TPR) repeat protein
MISRLRRLACGILLSACLAVSLSAQSSDEAVQRYSEQGQRALADARYSEAEQAFEKLRELEPGVAEVQANLGLVYFEERKYDQAVQALSQALKLKPGLPTTGTFLALSLNELGRHGDALPGLEKGFRQSADVSLKRMCGLQLMRAYSSLQQDSRAVAVALELNRLYPDDPELLYQSGRVYGNFAFLTMKKLSEVAPASVWRHQALAEASESQEAYDTAIGEYRQVLALDPHRPGIHYRIGRTLLARSRRTTSAEDAAGARKEFEQELEVNPANASAAYEIGEAHRTAGQFQQAQSFFAQALKFYPDFQEAQLGLASALMSQQRPQLALPPLQSAIRLNSEDEVAWYRLSQVQRALGNEQEAQKAFATFERLRKKKSSQQEAGKQMVSTEEVTRQTLDPKDKDAP